MIKLNDALALKLENIFSYLIGATCPACGRLGASICKSCAKKIADACLIKLDNTNPKYHGAVLVAFEYNSAIRKVILNFKYRNQRSSLRFIGDSLVQRLKVEQSQTIQKVNLVTWAPTTTKRRVERGFDHAELIAKYVAKQLSLPCRKVLVRLSDRPQTGKSRSARLVGPTFAARNLDAEHVLLIDDVVTTGATLNSASHALYQAGAGLVTCMAVASTVLWQSSTESYAPEKARK
ncbi:MAG: ComF family protein [Acidimicrobiaceae bacterium]